MCCFCKQQSNVVAYLRWPEEAAGDAPRPAHNKKTGARARDNILDTHKGSEGMGGGTKAHTRNTIHFRVVVHVLVLGIYLRITCVVNSLSVLCKCTVYVYSQCLVSF